MSARIGIIHRPRRSIKSALPDGRRTVLSYLNPPNAVPSALHDAWLFVAESSKRESHIE